MRSRLIPVLAALAGLAIASCDPRPATGGGGGPLPTTGAHTIHLTGTIAEPMDCLQCHNPQFVVTLEGFPASANGAQPSFDGGTLTCSNVYCHAGGPQLLLGGGTVPAPIWNPPSTVACGACHALPGGSIETNAWHPAVATAVDCGLCHPGYTRTIVEKSIHVNGEANLKAPNLTTSCTPCHGDATRVLPPGAPEFAKAAPPVDRSGSSDTRQPGVGAHQSHLAPGPGAISLPIACSECHVVPTGLAHVGPDATSPAKLAWGPLASANGASPGFDPASITCANYCHGQTLGAGGTIVRPVWTKVDDAQAACGTCHASQPADLSHLFHASPTILNLPCSRCHPSGYAIGSVGPEAVPIHVNGVINVNATWLPDWNPGAVGPNGWRGTSTVGCHGGTRYWSDAVPPVGSCY
jgi:predicted CxxxxCH...CXXCH cytochrome family protein